jgi:Zn-dependent protease with chaperone function
MQFLNTDIRLINGNIVALLEEIKNHTSKNNFRVISEDISENKAIIKSNNQKASLVSLFLSASPQIVTWNIEKRDKNLLQISISFSLFKWFRVFYYSTLCSLLFCSVIFYNIGNFEEFITNSDSFFSSSIFPTLCVLFVVLATFFELRLLNSTPYDNFLNRFYSSLTEKGFTNQIALRGGCLFPDFWQGVLILITFLVGFSVTLESVNTFSELLNTQYLFLHGLILVVCILITLVILMTLKPVFLSKGLFALVGMGLTILFSIYGNAPLINVITGDVMIRMENINNQAKIQLETYRAENKQVPREFLSKYSKLQKTIKWTVLMAGLLWFFVLSAVFLVVFGFFDVPIRLCRYLERFRSQHPESIYYNSIKEGISFLLFNAIIILYWIVITAANFTGIYFSLSIFEKIAWGKNYIFGAKCCSLFIDNMRILFYIIFESYAYILNIDVLYKFVILLYSFPMIFLLFVVLTKNWKSFKNSYSLIKSRDSNNIEIPLIEKVNEICSFANVRIPIIRVVNSEEINAESRYVGFPFFRNILSITSKALENLRNDDYEIDAFLAHEIWHIKSHTFNRKLICMISDYSLFGNGFLALIQNNFQIEKDADNFAAKWLNHRLKEKERIFRVFKNLLEKQEDITIINKIKKQHSNPGFSLNFREIKNDSYRKKILKIYDTTTKSGKIWMNLKLLYQMYFGEEILSYFHPPASQRLEWLKKSEAINE